MRKTVKTLFIVCVILCVFISPFVALADSGFDYDYDAGGGGYSDGGGSIGDDEAVAGVILVLFIIEHPIISLIIVIAIICIIIYERKRIVIQANEELEEVKENVEVLFEPNYAMPLIKQALPGFDRKVFLDQVLNLYKNIQIAYSRFDYDGLKNMVTTEMYNEYSIRIEELKSKHEQDIIEDYNVEFIGIGDAFIENGKLLIAVKLRIVQKRYTINIDTNEVIMGNQNDIKGYSYNLTFVNDVETNIPYVCPECEKTTKTPLVMCRYCNFKLAENEPPKWKLIKKEDIKQEGE